MSSFFSRLYAERLNQLTRAWVDEIYAERRTDLPRLLSFRELVEFVPEVCDELGALLDERAGATAVHEAARRLRVLAQTRYQQGALLDEVARELMILREVTAGFLWREAPEASGGEVECGELLPLLHRFFDEVIAQAILVYAVSQRPTFPTRDTVWPPPRARRGRTK
ncbi:MAG TPA: RsbRD N-terminal domain-containing protein [Pyrinomonadaceae bacterium]|nr:RsbRD N-terminal domain-containing protein [Pyrinomonadaceae bacterium]